MYSFKQILGFKSDNFDMNCTGFWVFNFNLGCDLGFFSCFKIGMLMSFTLGLMGSIWNFLYDENFLSQSEVILCVIYRSG
ncbi:unnamed protein product [Camellia sinensis]